MIFNTLVFIIFKECTTSHISGADQTSCEPIPTIHILQDTNDFLRGLTTTPDQIKVRAVLKVAFSQGILYHI